MEMLGVLLSLLIVVTCLILPWLNRSSIGALRRRIEQLEADLHALKSASYAPENPRDSIAHRVAEYTSKRFSYTPDPDQEPSAEDQSEEDIASVSEASSSEATQSASAVFESEQETEKPRAFEQIFGGRAFVWLGGIALALAGFFLVKYSIETGFLTEKIRVILGFVLGVGLLGSSFFVLHRPQISSGDRIAQALAGAGIADLYACFYAGTSLYHFFPTWFGFGGMALVTGLALVLALRYGAPIAVLGLLGGFTTPMVVHGAQPSAPFLFGYLYLVYCGLAYVASQKNWWGLSILATLASFLWVAAWLVGGLSGVDGACLALFIFGLCATVVAVTQRVSDDEEAFQPQYFRSISIGGSIVLAAFITHFADYGVLEWSLFGLLSLGAIVLAWCDDENNGLFPWLAMVMNALALFRWDVADPVVYAMILLGFGLVFTSAAFILMLKSKAPVSWAGLSVISAALYYLLGYEKLDSFLVYGMRECSFFSANALWAVIAMVFAAFYAKAVHGLSTRQSDILLRHRQQAIFSTATAGFVSLGFAILLNQEYLVFVLAMQVLTLAWIDRKMDLPALRPLAQLIALLFAGLLISPVWRLFFHIPFNDFVSYDLSKKDILPGLLPLVFQFGLPSMVFAASGRLMQRKRDDRFVRILELASVALFVTFVSDLLELLIVGESQKAAFMVRGLFADILLLTGYAALYAGRRFSRPAYRWGGLALCGVSLLRLVSFDLVFDNPLWAHEFVGSWPIANILIVVYALPALLIYPVRKELAHLKIPGAVETCHVLTYILAFTFISLNVRQFYHGAYLDMGVVTNAEVYSYSVTWLLAGIALILAGTLRQDRMMRVASLITMLVAIGKVFLYDASELTGLWRVFSFFGLGLCLLALSWFYARFVFNSKTTE